MNLKKSRSTYLKYSYKWKTLGVFSVFLIASLFFVACNSHHNGENNHANHHSDNHDNHNIHQEHDDHHNHGTHDDEHSVHHDGHDHGDHDEPHGGHGHGDHEGPHGGHGHGDHADHPPHGADNAEEETESITVWSDTTEVFLKYGPIIVGEWVQFATHITELSAAKPREQGPLTFVFQFADEEPIEYIEEHPVRPGLYVSPLIFPKQGEWQVKLFIRYASQEDVISLPPVYAYASTEDIQHSHEHGPEGISFHKEQQWNISLKTSVVENRELNDCFRSIGVVSLPPENQAHIVAPGPGTLLVAENRKFPVLAERVESGQVLARIQPYLGGADILTFASTRTQLKQSEVEISTKISEQEANKGRSEVEIELARKKLKRIQELYDKNAKSQKQLEEAEFSFQTAKAKLDAATNLLKSYQNAKNTLASLPALSNTLPAFELRAPISGTISEVKGVIGENVQPGDLVFTIMDTQHVFIEARVPESDIGRLHSSKDAVYELPYSTGKYHSIKDNNGVLVTIGPDVGTKSRTIPIIYKIQNTEGTLLPGMSLNVLIETSHFEQAIAIPESAIVEEDGRTIAFVQISGELFQKRDVRLGIQDGEFIQILSGLNAGERVVTTGAYPLRLASASTSIPAHGHAH